MIVSKNSWHYKLIMQWGSGDVPNILSYNESLSLCQYFWGVIRAILGLLVTIIMASVLFGGVAYVCIAPIALVFSAFTGIWWDIPKYYELGMFILIFAPITLLFAGIGATLFGPMKVFPKWFPVDKWVGMATPKKVNILVEWIKAKKSKVCPIIELKGE